MMFKIKRLKFVFILCYGLSHFSIAQTIKVDSTFWVVSNNPLSKKGNNSFTMSEEIDSLFNSFNIISYEKALLFLFISVL